MTSCIPRTLLAWLAALLACAAAPSAVAQDYPSKPIRVIVPWPAGGLVDIAARAVATRLQAGLAQTVIVDNKVGAGGLIGADQGAKATPDGYTLVLTTSALTINTAMRTKMSFDAMKDLEPISVVAYAPSVLVVNAAGGPTSVQELLKFAKANPGKLSYGSAGVGSPAHFAGELLKSKQGLFIVHVPYTGAPAAMTDQIAGRIDFHFANIAVALPQIRSGRVRALAVTSAGRTASLPEVPTMAEAGVAGFEADQWLGILAPRGLPRAVVDRLVGEVNKALAADEVRATLVNAGMTAAAPGTASAFDAYLKQDLAKWTAVVKAANIQSE